VTTIIAEFWGKARPNHVGAASVHPLPAHSLDVAAVAILLPGPRNFNIDPRMLGFLVSLHDIGKYSRPFQAKARECWPTGALGPYPSTNPPPGPAHDVVGMHFLSDVLANRVEDLLPAGAGREPGWKASDRMHLWRALAGPHGRPPAEANRISRAVVCNDCHDAAGEFLDAMRLVFRPPPWKRPASEREVVQFSWCLAGLTTLSDWVGSRQAWFPYAQTAAVADPAAYFWSHALPRAAAALAASGLAASAPAPFTGLRGLFPGISLPTPIQQWAEEVALPDGPGLAVIEDLTGSGKTEAALTLAHRLLAGGRANGVYLALPTMATANAMFGRLSASYRALFAPDARPSLALAHGRAALDPRFAAAIEGEGIFPSRAGYPGDEPAESHCASWLAQDRRRALLAQVGVGTLDQALLAVLPVRHAMLRLQGITGKVLIVDEVHAFDPYMREELATLLRFHAALGGSAILLSATLPRTLRRKLINAFRDGLGQKATDLVEQAYPLATIAGAHETYEMPCKPRAGLPRRVAVARLSDVGAAMERIAAAAKAGAATVWIRNTVDDAIEAVALLRAAGIEPLLFHARYAMADRLTIEREVLRLFGRDSTGEMRNRVLVATQVVEQSLDIDFDVMVTDLAPADLLIQRVGRLWRHDRGPRGVAGPELLVVSPEPVDEPAADWIMAALPGTGSVYRDHALLWRSARQVFGRAAIVTPDDMRPIIEAVFDRDADGAVPRALAASGDDAYANELSRIGIAAQNVLDFRKGYAADAGAWEPDTNTPTRLEDQPHVMLRLACLRDGAIVPYAEEPDGRRAWALSEVSVARYRIASCPLLPGLQVAVDEAKAEWGRWERDSPFFILALMTPDGNGYRLDARAESGAVVAARYDARTGLSWSRPDPAPAG
jgi:CRISPR-associated endonuclease/helicase Cas3